MGATKMQQGDGARIEPLEGAADRDSAYELFARGRSMLAAGHPHQAVMLLSRAKLLEPEKASIREALGIAYFRIHRYEEAESEFRKMLELAPVDDYAHYALGRCLEKQGREQEANGHYKLASSLRPGEAAYASRIRDLD
jgi:Flp pilus assembly protein TadD